MIKMMAGFTPFGAGYVDYVVKIVGSCIFPIKICAGLVFFHRKICNICIKSRDKYAENALNQTIDRHDKEIV